MTLTVAYNSDYNKIIDIQYKDFLTAEYYNDTYFNRFNGKRFTEKPKMNPIRQNRYH